jgi:putative transposase
MSRPLRIEFPGAVYQITSRGNARDKIFLDDRDREIFLLVLASVIKRYNWLCHAYCLMDNHYHLLIETVDGNLSIGMRQLNGMYTQRYDFRYQRPGHVFQGRFKAILVEKDSYLLELCRYVVLNPVRARIVDKPGDWKWSSFRATSGFEKAPTYLTTDWVLGTLSEQRKVAQIRYREFVLDGVGQSSPLNAVRGQILLGSEKFKDKFEDVLLSKKALKEIPRSQRLVNRPNLEEMFSGVKSKKERNHAIREAHLQHGYMLKEIADHIGIHYTTVSKLIQLKVNLKD